MDINDVYTDDVDCVKKVLEMLDVQNIKLINADDLGNVDLSNLEIDKEYILDCVKDGYHYMDVV